MIHDDGGPAFPSVWNGDEPQAQHGMSLRDYFAAQIAAGFAGSNGTPWIEDGDNTTDEKRMKHALRRAKNCYLMADAMLAARKPEDKAS